MAKATTWVTRWKGMEVSAEPVMPGVYRRKESGFVVRGSAKDPRTGKLVEVFRVLPDLTDPKEAMAWLTLERKKIREGRVHEEQTRPPLLRDFAVSLLETKIKVGEIVSEAGKEKWGSTIAHLVKAPFSGYFLDQVKDMDVRAWVEDLPLLTYTKGKKKNAREVPYGNATLNTWLSILRVIFKAATQKHRLIRDPMLGIDNFPTITSYTEEEPNALSPEEDEVSLFLAEMKKSYPQHFVMTLLGIVIGQRPSTLRPLLRRGETPDLIFNADGTATILLRRSNSRGHVVTDRTRLGNKGTANPKVRLDASMAAQLKAHIAEVDRDPVMRKSDLLFPSPVTGKIRSRSSLRIPFQRVAKACGLKKNITPKAMRRTFKDLARAVGMEAVVRKAISGHATDAMDTHYSTAHKPEVARALGNLYDLATARAKLVSG